MNGFGWTCKRKTCLFAKNNDAKDSKNYRSITCLLTVHKFLTSVLTVRAYLHLEQNDFFPLEQEGCRRGSYGCKDQPMINKMILQNCKKRKWNLSCAWIDYKKTFHSVLHEWILRYLELFKASSRVIAFLKHSMNVVHESYTWVCHFNVW